MREGWDKQNNNLRQEKYRNEGGMGQTEQQLKTGKV